MRLEVENLNMFAIILFSNALTCFFVRGDFCFSYLVGILVHDLDGFRNSGLVIISGSLHCTTLVPNVFDKIVKICCTSPPGSNPG